MSAPAWLRKAIVEGLQGLFVLRLQGAPSHDTAKAVANAWVTVIATRPIAWDEQRDLPRVRRAFVDLAATSTHWPAPAAFLSALRPSLPSEVKQLTKPQSKTIPPAATKALDAFLKRGRNIPSSESP